LVVGWPRAGGILHVMIHGQGLAVEVSRRLRVIVDDETVPKGRIPILPELIGKAIQKGGLAIIPFTDFSPFRALPAKRSPPVALRRVNPRGESYHEAQLTFIFFFLQVLHPLDSDGTPTMLGVVTAPIWLKITSSTFYMDR
jgi:hypothetical protein